MPNTASTLGPSPKEYSINNSDRLIIEGDFSADHTISQL
jgi:hypothetical protein